MFLLGILLITGIVLWKYNLRFEWSVPSNWQKYIESWKEGLSSRTHNLKYIWYMGRGNSELEKHFFHLQMALPGLQKRLNVPIWLVVFIHQGRAYGQNELYISCLQRRFPGIEIQECSLNESNYPNE